MLDSRKQLWAKVLINLLFWSVQNTSDGHFDVLTLVKDLGALKSKSELNSWTFKKTNLFMTMVTFLNASDGRWNDIAIFTIKYLKGRESDNQISNGSSWFFL